MGGGSRKREKPLIFRISSTTPFQSPTRRLYRVAAASTLTIWVPSACLTGGLSRRELRSLNLLHQGRCVIAVCLEGVKRHAESCGVVSSGSI
jgi:hypothetical protein